MAWAMNFSWLYVIMRTLTFGSTFGTERSGIRTIILPAAPHGLPAGERIHVSPRACLAAAPHRYGGKMLLSDSSV